MQALQSLIREHQVISRVVSSLEAYAQELEQRSAGPAAFDAADLARFSDVFTELAECLHHEKEENILLPLLSRHGFDWHAGVLPEVRREHRQEAYLIDVLRQASERAGSWHDADRHHIAASARALVEFQRAHHRLENEKLFPEIQARLGAGALDQLGAALDKFDREHEWRRNAAFALAEELVARYAPQQPATQRTSTG